MDPWNGGGTKQVKGEEKKSTELKQRKCLAKDLW